MAFVSGLPPDLKAALDAASSIRVNDLVGEIGWAWSRGASGTTAPPPPSASAAATQRPSEEAALAALERSWEESCVSAAGTLALFDELAQQHRSVASLASSLHDRCKELAELEAKTRNVVVKVSQTLSVFDSYYVIASRLGVVAVEDREAAALALRLADECAADAAAAGAPPPAVAPRGPQLLPGQPEFAAALDRIDECIAHLAAHTGYKEATAFLQRFRALQTAALQGVVRTVQDAISRSASAAHAEVRTAIAAEQTRHRVLPGGPGAGGDAARRASLQASGAQPSQPLAAAGGAAAAAAAGGSVEAVELTHLYVRQRAELLPARPLLCLVETRAQRRAYADLVQACYSHYLRRRHEVVAEVLAFKLRGAVTRATQRQAEAPAAAAAAVFDAIRHSCAVASRTLQAEHALFHTLFVSPPPAATTGAPGSMAAAGGAAQAAGSAVSGGSHASIWAGGMPAHLRSAADAALSGALDDLAGLVVDTLRPLILHLGGHGPASASLASLADVIVVLRDEVILGVAVPRGAPLAPLARAVGALVHDVQERLAFRSQSVIAHLIEGYRGSSATQRVAVSVPVSLADGRRATVTEASFRGDLDYPGLLLAHQLRLRSSAAAAAASSIAAAPATAAEPVNASASGGESEPPPRFPPLAATLSLLASAHRALERGSFEVLAQDAVAACTRSLVAAARTVSAARDAEDRRAPTGAAARRDAYVAERVVLTIDGAGDAPVRGVDTPGGSLARGVLASAADIITASGAVPSSAAVDSSLFVVRSLLTLREQLSPFHVQLISTTRTVDFAPTAAAFAELVSHGPGMLRSLLVSGERSSLVAAVSRGLPSVHEEQSDAKKDLESLLKSSCEAFISAAVQLLVGRIAETLARPRHLPPQQQQQPDGAAAAVAAWDAFSSHAQSQLEATLAALPDLLLALRRRAALYMGSGVTAGILFKPVLDSCGQALAGLRRQADELAAAAASAVERAQQEALEGGQAAPLASPGSSSAATLGRLRALCDEVQRLLQASDGLAVDASGPGFGYDDHVLAPLRPMQQQPQLQVLPSLSDSGTVPKDAGSSAP